MSRVYGYLKYTPGRIHVHHVIEGCGIPREESVTILQKLKSMGYIAGNAKDGYWLTPKELSPSIEKAVQEVAIDKVFSYLEVHREISLSQIAEGLHLPTLKVKELLEELDRRGKIKLQD